MRVALQPAFVLHRRPYRESSLILEVLSRDHGRVGLLARGARGSRRGRGSVLQAFHPLLISWSGRGELPTVTGAENAYAPTVIPQDRLPHAFYLNELLLALLPRDDAHPVLFAAYADAVSGLPGDAEKVLRRFEVTLLEALGFLPELTVEAESGQAVQPAVRYRFELERGPLRDDDAPSSPWVVTGAVLLALEAGRFDDIETRRAARRLMQAVLAHYLGGRALKSRELFRRQPR